jgi:hypothetical protein
MFDPTYPPANAEIESAPLRNQFNALKALIDAIQNVTSAQVDAVTTVPEGNPAVVTVQLVGSTLQFTFAIPQGVAGQPGSPGAPGEVSLAELNAAISTTPWNPFNVSTLGISFSDPVSAADLNLVTSKLDELITVLKRQI